jgi:hypothetical protein
MREEAFIEKINYLYELERYNQVIELSMKYLYTEHDYNEFLYTKIIESNLHLKVYDKAEVFVKKALKIFPNSSYYHALFARIHLGRRNYFKALQEIDKALNLESNDDYLFYLKAVILNDNNDYKDAQKMIEKALGENSNNTDYMYVYALILYNLSNKKYKKILHDILAIDPNNSNAIYLMGSANKSFSKQKNSFLKALRIDPFSKTYQSALQSNKRDLLLYLLAILAVILETFLIFNTNVPSALMNGIIIFLVLSIIHLSYYSFQTYFLVTIAVLPYFISRQGTHVSSLIVALLSSLFIAYFLRNIATFFKSSVLSMVEVSRELKSTIKYLTKEDLPALFMLNIPKLILFVLTTLTFLQEYENWKMISGSMLFIIPIYVLIMKKQFNFLLLLQAFGFLYILMVVSNIISGQFDEYAITLNYMLAILMGITYTVTIRRIG